MNATHENAAHEVLSQEYLDAFVDGELSGEERARALARLEADPDFRRRVCELRTLKEQVKGAYELAPARAHSPRHASGGARQMLAATLLLGLGLTGGWFAHGSATSTPVVYDRLAGLPAGYQAIAMAEQVDADKLILHLDSGEPGRLAAVLDLADKLLRERGAAARVEIVANSDGLDLLRADVSPERQRIADLARRHGNLSFVACGQTVARLKREGTRVELLPDAHTASSAINEIMTRMGQGWVYVKV